MSRLADAHHVAQLARDAGDLEILSMLIGDMAREMGFRHFILGHHFDSTAAIPNAVVIHNYPDGWAEYFTTHQLHVNDPVLRASERSQLCFRWSAVPKLVKFSGQDRQIMEDAISHGLTDGCTVPFQKPGELPGSISFATPKGEVDDEKLLFAQLIGSLAFEAARRVSLEKGGLLRPDVKLTERQRECLILAARGQTDAEIARTLGISEETATLHLKTARERYGVSKRLPLAIRALYDGQISFWEAIG